MLGDRTWRWRAGLTGRCSGVIVNSMPLDTTVSSTSLRPAYVRYRHSELLRCTTTVSYINMIQSTSAELIEVVTMEFVFTEVVSMDLGQLVEVVSIDFGPPPPPPPKATAAAQGDVWANKEMPSTSEEMPIRSSSTSSWFERVCDFVSE